MSRLVEHLPKGGGVSRERRRTLLMHGSRFRKDLERKNWKVTDAGIKGGDDDYLSYEYVMKARYEGLELRVQCGHDTKEPQFFIRREPFKGEESPLKPIDRIPPTDIAHTFMGRSELCLD